MALRRHYLPHEPDDMESLARALWLDKHMAERHSDSVSAGICKAFKG